jgi:WD40 repeat protein
MRSSSRHLAAVFTLAVSALAADTPALRQTIALPSGISPAFTAVSPNGQLVAAACNDAKIRLWDVALASLKGTLDLNGERPTVVQFSPDGALLAAGGWSGTLRLWDSSGALRHELKLSARIDALAFSPDGTRVAVALSEMPVEIRNLADGKPLASFPATFSGSAALAFSRDGRWLASADSDTEIRIIDSVLWRFTPASPTCCSNPLAITFSPDGTRVIAGGADGVVTLIDSDTGKVVKSFSKQADVLYILRASSDGKLIAGAYFNPDQVSAPGRILIWDTQTGSLRSTVRPVDSGFNGGEYAQDGTLLLTSSTEKSLKVWSTR